MIPSGDRPIVNRPGVVATMRQIRTLWGGVSGSLGLLGVCMQSLTLIGPGVSEIICPQTHGRTDTKTLGHKDRGDGLAKMKKIDYQSFTFILNAHSIGIVDDCVAFLNCYGMNTNSRSDTENICLNNSALVFQSTKRHSV